MLAEASAHLVFWNCFCLKCVRVRVCISVCVRMCVHMCVYVCMHVCVMNYIHVIVIPTKNTLAVKKVVAKT